MPQPETDNSVTHLTDTVIIAITLRARNFRYAQRATSTGLLIQERNKLRTLWQRTQNIARRPRKNALIGEVDTTVNS
jgi:hypothetical protein